jgi:hypothetical protein
MLDLAGFLGFSKIDEKSTSQKDKRGTIMLVSLHCWKLTPFWYMIGVWRKKDQ